MTLPTRSPSRFDTPVAVLAARYRLLLQRLVAKLTPLSLGRLYALPQGYITGWSADIIGLPLSFEPESVRDRLSLTEGKTEADLTEALASLPPGLAHSRNLHAADVYPVGAGSVGSVGFVGSVHRLLVLGTLSQPARCGRPPMRIYILKNREESSSI